MFSTCIFCNASLGANEVIEQFPVGRRVAYDQSSGRLWVICSECKRWNLSPFETRFEAIESAERAFRSTRIRVSTDNVGLARLRDGTELVRIGEPLRAEFVAWRYGKQFASRRRKFIALGAVTALGTAAPLLGPVFGASLVGSFLTIGYSATNWQRLWVLRNVPRATIIDNAGVARRLSHANFGSALLGPANSGDGWKLELPYMETRPTGALMRWLGVAERRDSEYVGPAVRLSGDPAINALRVMLPYLNRGGGNETQLHDALTAIDHSRDLSGLIRDISVSEEVSGAHFKKNRGLRNIIVRPARLRLALEMSLHETEERRAMEGELHELEARWREADAIAKIADALLLPERVQDRVDEMRSRGDRR